MSDKEPQTEKFGFTQSKILHFLGQGEDLTKDDLMPIRVYGDHAGVCNLVHELAAAAPQPHWYAEVDVPENATINTRMYADFKMSEQMWNLTQKLLDKYGLPKVEGKVAIL